MQHTSLEISLRIAKVNCLLEFQAPREQWDRAGSPKERLLACVENAFGNRDVLAR
jgi:hypothetical protein